MPTQIPNSGYVDKVYFNTNLTRDEVENIIKDLEFSNLNGLEFIPIFTNADNTKVLCITKSEVDNVGVITTHYNIILITDISTLDHIIFFEGFLPNGWFLEEQGLSNPYEINDTGVATSLGLEVGLQNDKLSSIVSITPFEEPIALKPFLKGIADAIREKKKTTELINAQNFRSEILSIKGGLIEVSELPEVGEEDVVYKLVKQGGVAIPTSGLVEKVYINTNYTEEEIKGIIEEYAIYPLQEGMLAYPIAVDINTGSVLAMLYNDTGFYAIGVVSNDGLSWTLVTDKLLWGISLSTGEGVFDNEMLSLNWTTISEAEGIPIGSKNNELANLISTTNKFGNFEVEYFMYESGAWVKISGINIVSKDGTVVPNSGYVEKVYFNTDLSNEEIVSLLSSLTYDESSMYCILFASNDKIDLEALKISDNQFAIADFVSMTIYYHNSSDFEIEYGFIGWNPNLINPIGINEEILEGGTENDKLINLISTSPFENQVIKELSGDYEAVELEVTENTTVDVGAMLEEKKLPLSVTVNVDPNLQEKEITENGEYVADEGYDGFSKVTVNVAGDDGLEKIIISKYNNTRNFSGLFQSISLGTGLDYQKYLDLIANLTTNDTNKNVLNIGSLFSSNYDLHGEISLTFDCLINQGMSSTFSNCSNVEKITISENYQNVISGTFSTFVFKCTKLKEIIFNCNAKPTSLYRAFSQATSLKKITGVLDMLRCTDTSQAFYDCKALEEITLKFIKTGVQLGSGDGTGTNDYGHLLTLESLINTVKECINVGSARTLTMGTANLSKIASTYVKFTDSSVTTIPTNEKGDVVVCERTDTGAMLLSDYALLKNWTLA